MCQKVLDPADTYCLKVLQLCQSLFIHDDRTFEFAVKGFLNSPVGSHTLKSNQSRGQLTGLVGPVHCCSPLCGLCSSRSQVDASLYAVRHLITRMKCLSKCPANPFWQPLDYEHKTWWTFCGNVHHKTFTGIYMCCVLWVLTFDHFFELSQQDLLSDLCPRGSWGSLRPRRTRRARWTRLIVKEIQLLYNFN